MKVVIITVLGVSVLFIYIFLLYKYKQSNKKPPQIGMTEKEMKASSWGTPIKIQRIEVGGLLHEEWAYEKEKQRFAYLENGIVVALQDKDIFI